MLKKKSIFLVLLLSIILVLSACGSDKASETEKEEPNAESVEPAEEETAEAEESTEGTASQNVEIIATDFKFDKEKYVVKAGEEVTVTLTSKKGTHGIDIQGINESIKAPNGKVTFTPEKPGEYPIICNVFCGTGHGEMTATLVVE